MSATLIARQKVSEYDGWRKAYDSAETIRDRHGCTGESVLRSPKDHNLVFITHQFRRWSRQKPLPRTPSCIRRWRTPASSAIPASSYSRTSPERRCHSRLPAEDPAKQSSVADRGGSVPAPDTDEALLAFASNHRVMECSAWLTRCQTTWIAFPAARCGGDNCLYDAASHAFPGQSPQTYFV